MNPITVFLLIVVGVFVLIALMNILVEFFREFSKDLEYLNMEIARSSGSERKYWQKKKRRLLLSILPFARRR